MNDEIRSLIESLRRGQYEDPSEKIGLLAAALREHKAEAELIVSLLQAAQIPLRLAALEACRGRSAAGLLGELAKLAADPEARVRAKLAEVLGSLPEKFSAGRLKSLGEDSDEDVRLAAVKSSSGKPSFFDLQRTLLAGDPEWQVRVAAANALGEQQAPAAAKELLTALANDEDRDVQQPCADFLEKRLTHAKTSTEKHLPQDITLLSKADRSLTQLGGRRFPKLLEWIRAHTTVAVNPQELGKFGTDLTELAAGGTLPRAYGVAETCEHLLSMLRRERWRSIVLLGEAGTGKSAVVNELVYHLAKPENGGWRVLRISPTDFMDGTKYLGEWETKVRELVEAVKKPRRVLIYVPNLSDLSAAGRWSQSDSNVATALAPYLEEGSIIVLGESAPAEYERGLGAIPSLQRLFDKVLIKEASLDQTRDVLKSIRDEAKVPLTDEVLGRLLDLATQYLSHLSRPGNTALLLRAMIVAQRENAEPNTTTRRRTGLISTSAAWARTRFSGMRPDCIGSITAIAVTRPGRGARKSAKTPR